MTNVMFKKLTVLSMILMLALGPAVSFAKEKESKINVKAEVKVEKNKDENKGEKKEKNNSCFRAFGHLIAPGFIKKHGEVEFDFNCFLPFGIAKKFRGVSTSTATTTLDTVAPVISSLAVNALTNKATVTWKTNEASDSSVFWSTTSGVNVNSTSTLSITKSSRVRDHKVVIENLNASTTYYLVVRSKDRAGNTATSSQISFTTKGAVLDTSLPVVSQIGVATGTSTINVLWKTNELATSRLYYGTSASLNVNSTTTSFIENTTLKTDHSLTLSGLATSTAYFMAIESKDGSGNRTVTPVFTSTTGF